MGEGSGSRRHFGTIRKLPSGRYQVRFWQDSRQRADEQTFGTKSDAMTRLAILEHQFAVGDWIDPALARQRFAPFADEWRATRVALRASTRAGNEQYLRTHVLPTFGAMELRTITPKHVRSWLAAMSAAGKSPATVHKAFQVLRMILAAAVDEEAIRTNPCDRVRKDLPKIEQPSERYLTPDEVVTLAGAIDGLVDVDAARSKGRRRTVRYSAAVVVAAYGGLRAGELFGLKWRHVDLLRRELRIEENLVEVRGELVTNAPKTKNSIRTISLSDAEHDALAKQQANAVNSSRDAYVFVSEDGGPVRLNNWRRRYWRPAVRAAGLEPLRIHDLRHTAVAIWIRAGANVSEIADRAGHFSGAFSVTRYGHLYDDARTRLAAEISRVTNDARAIPTAPVVALGRD